MRGEGVSQMSIRPEIWKRVGKITKKAIQMKKLHLKPKYGDYGHKDGWAWPRLMTPGPFCSEYHYHLLEQYSFRLLSKPITGMELCMNSAILQMEKLK